MVAETGAVKVGKTRILGFGGILTDLCVRGIKQDMSLIVNDPDFCGQIGAEHLHL